MNRYLSSLLFSLLLLPNFFTVAHAQQAKMIQQLDKAIDSALTEQRIVGAVVLVSQNGQLIYHHAAGFADRETKRPMTEDTIFRLSSVTKPLVTLAALRLIEEGKLNLDDPVTKYLPNFRPKLADGTTPTITIHQLLTHTAGLNYGFFEKSKDDPYHKANVSDGLNQPGLSMDENLKRMTHTPLLYQPGTSWQYSLSMDVLGEVLSKVTKKSLPEVIETYVTIPLNMKDTAFTVTDSNRLATPYINSTPTPRKMKEIDFVPIFDMGEIEFVPDRYKNQDSFASGGAGMIGTATDFMKFLNVLEQQGKPILSSALASQMFTDYTEGKAQAQGPGWGFSYGGAILINPKEAQTPQSKGTIQWGGVYGHNWFYDPIKKLSVVIFTNTTLEGMAGQFPNDIRDAVYNL